MNMKTTKHQFREIGPKQTTNNNSRNSQQNEEVKKYRRMPDTVSQDAYIKINNCVWKHANQIKWYWNSVLIQYWLHNWEWNIARDAMSEWSYFMGRGVWNKAASELSKYFI